MKLRIPVLLVAVLALFLPAVSAKEISPSDAGLLVRLAIMSTGHRCEVKVMEDGGAYSFYVKAGDVLVSLEEGASFIGAVAGAVGAITVRTSWRSRWVYILCNGKLYRMATLYTRRALRIGSDEERGAYILSKLEEVF